MVGSIRVTPIGPSMLWNQQYYYPPTPLSSLSLSLSTHAYTIGFLSFLGFEQWMKRRERLMGTMVGRQKRQREWVKKMVMKL
ncbi:hypothetical protein LOK49_LG03G02262 [Camellia lanceoleosa]|uniref:Uncharacterized protein n=1 Tax=Camellia lanceoleosa TaxID=1840588 RepID=A0ACC0I6S1_9ERIC|nr:hypothetical protein LOK49_LG03G02262 [Camellia lanceoleosa]